MMMKSLFCLIVFLMILSGGGIAAAASECTAVQSSARIAAQDNTAFALDLYDRLKAEEGNLFFSPYSISCALAMTYAGARGNTEKQMADVLHFTLRQTSLHPALASLESRLETLGSKGDVELNVANALWPQKKYPLLQSYLDLTKQYYGVEITPLDYEHNADAARQIINRWVEEQTRDRIQDLIKEGVLGPLVRLVLTNAVYFKGDWDRQFDAKLTREAPFYPAPGKSVDALMMNQKEMFNYMEDDTLQVLELPYRGNDLSMLVLLPRRPDGLPAMEEQLTRDNLDRWTGRLKRREVMVYLPKFKLTDEFRLDETLRLMGMSDAFSMKADFSGMDGTKNLYISAVVHKAFVAVDEQGTEAAAATGVVVSVKSIALPPPVFRADHPFVFLIRDNQTGSILFIGRIVNPAV